LLKQLPLYKLFSLAIFCLLFVANTVAQINFVENKGQWETSVKYRAEIPGGLLYVENGTLSYILADAAPFKIMHDEGHYDAPVQMHYFKVVFEGSNPNPTYKNEQTATAYYNFFLGNNPKKWASGVNAHGKITVQEIYPGIDLELYSSRNNAIKYNLIIKPGANPDVIKVRYIGLDDIHINNSGQLHLKTAIGELTELAPICYQLSDTTVTYVKTDYSLKGNLLTFDIKEKYNRKKSFVIDPELVFSTYSGAFGDNWGFTGTWDNDGNGYSGGASYFYGGFSGSNGSFPVTPGAFQTKFKNGVEGVDEDLARDAAVYKVSSDGKTLIYATYLGGTNNEEPHSMIVNSKNELIVFGTTFSNDFPVSGYDNSFNGSADIFVFVLSADGKSMIGSTFVGGIGVDGLNGDANPMGTVLAYNYGDQYRGEVIVDNSDNIYVATSTQSSGNFPLLNAFQTTYGGNQDGCVFKLNSTASNLIWSSYLGGPGVDACNGLDLDSKGNLLVAGGTTLGLIGVNPGMGSSTTIAGGISDGFLVKISPAGNKMLNATYMGTPSYDQTYFVKVDKFDAPYVTGQTDGNWPIIMPIYNNTNGGQFINKYSENLGTVTRSMVYGGGTIKPQISPSAFLVDECERIFVSGWGGNVNRAPRGHGGFTTNLPKTSDAYQPNTDGSDFYLAVFSKNLDTILYGTFFGGRQTDPNSGEHVDGGTSRFDRKGIVYQSVCAGCGKTPFPTTAGAHSQANNSNNCNNAILKLDFENLNRAPVVDDKFYTVEALQTLEFDYIGYDADPYDTLFLDIDTSAFAKSGFPSPKPSVSYPGKGLKHLTMHFKWTPGCEHVTGDTLVFKVKIQDMGCPDFKSDTAIIKILVTAPPVLDPPDVLCVVPVTTSSVKLRWTGMDTTSPYFSHVIITKTDPQGNTSTLGPFKKGGLFEFVDDKVFDYRNKNYCYSVFTVNICGVKGKSSYTICTKDQFDSPISTTDVFTVTVVDNKDVKVVWYDTHEDDFESYLLFRSPRTSGHVDDDYQFYGSSTKTDDTVFIDKNVKVNNQSFCYKLQVTDKCGHVSKFSNKGCNIVLRGHSEPYIHKLTWDDYQVWENDVDNYELIRWDDRIDPKKQIYQGAPAVLDYQDENFDYDWGGYWYKVVAHENAGNNATSESNEIYLIQKPLLHVPSAFTPNNDKLNETWGQVDVFVKDYHMQVYNRWGEKVFESFDKNEQWTGAFTRTGPADNVFIWIVRYTGWDKSIHHQKGTVTILN
jgi:gliding motility-associated-like protein